ncbi:MAG: copper resistance protein B [Pseudoxanthomonas sp.]
MKVDSRTSLMLVAALASVAVSAQARAQHDHAQHSTQAEAEKISLIPPVEPAADAPALMDHASMDHAAMGHAATGHDVATSPTSITPIAPVSDADRAAAFPVLDHHAMEHAPAIHRYLQFNRMEAWDADEGTGQAWEAIGWWGSDLNRLWLRSEGERVDGRTEASDLEVMYGRSLSPWWDMLVGVKQDFRPEDSQTWAAFGVQGLAPYKFEVSATAYLGESGQSAATIEVEYELLLTQRMILQPMLELKLYGQDDPLRRIGSGLSRIEAGLRLRYEINRHVAPYVGVVQERILGRTADYHAAHGEDNSDTRVVAGIRFWF